jgi:hypothetical protein
MRLTTFPLSRLLAGFAATIALCTVVATPAAAGTKTKKDGKGGATATAPGDKTAGGSLGRKIG